MELVLVLLGVGFILELLLYLPFIWQKNILPIVFCVFSTSLTVFTSVSLLLIDFNVASTALVFISVYRVINILRIAERRMNPRYLHNVALRTSASLAVIQSVVLCAWWLAASGYLQPQFWLAAACTVQVFVGIILLGSTIRRLKHTRLTHTEMALTTNELPSVTIAIPARNETEDLYNCLQSLIKNNYPKLEILVLDDCSQLRRTPEIIREFAHSGVRFVKGEEPKDNWLAKNQAYDKLLHEASGEIIIFAGVDVRFEPETIRQIVVAMLARNKRMLSILPTRFEPHKFQYAAVQAARYFWELAPPRRLFNRPPVLSSCWGIYRKDLLKLGGFAAVSRAILPEAYFAKQVLTGDGYSFVRASKELSLFSAKGYKEQRETAIRVRYPQLHRRPETVLMVTLVGSICFVLPFGLIILSLAGSLSVVYGMLAALAVLMYSITYALIATKTGTNSWYIAPFCFLPIVLTDMALTHYSLFRYEFSEVIWKGRNICTPVMHVIPHLPRI